MIVYFALIIGVISGILIGVLFTLVKIKSIGTLYVDLLHGGMYLDLDATFDEIAKRTYGCFSIKPLK